MFQKALKKKSKLRLAICGPSGSGKTYSALSIAKGIGGKVAVVDTEGCSANLYADKFDFDCVEFDHYAIDKFISAIKEAENQKYSVLIFDSLSAAWSGAGGILDIVDVATKKSKSGNSYQAWSQGTPKQNELINKILTSDLHIIATMRTKTAYEIVKNSDGKVAPKKIGLAPVQRADIEYEFTIVMDIDVDGHFATTSKDRTGIFDSRSFVPDESIGVELVAWLESGVTPKTQDEIIKEYIVKIGEVKSYDELKKLDVSGLNKIKEQENIDIIREIYRAKKDSFDPRKINDVKVDLEVEANVVEVEVEVEVEVNAVEVENKKEVEVK